MFFYTIAIKGINNSTAFFRLRSERNIPRAINQNVNEFLEANPEFEFIAEEDALPVDFLRGTGRWATIVSIEPEV